MSEINNNLSIDKGGKSLGSSGSPNAFLLYFSSDNWGNPFNGQFGPLAVDGLMHGAGLAIGLLGGSAISNGYESTAGNVLGIASNIASAIPGPWGAVASAGLGLMSGAANVLTGIKTNLKLLSSINLGMASLNNDVAAAVSARSLDDLALVAPTAVSRADVYKGGVFARGKAAKKNADLRLEIADKYAFATNAVANSANNIIDLQMSDVLASYAAYGGLLGSLHTNGADFSNGLVFINNGGTHEANPLEGVPMGVDLEGVPNLVEEGEVVFNDYVFSNRLKVPKAVRQKYKLRGNKPLTFADAVKLISKESEERPNDPISQRGLQDGLMALMLSLEELRLAKLKKLFAEGGNTYGKGGPKYNYDWYLRQARMLGMAEDDLADFKSTFSNTDKDNLSAFNTLANTWTRKQAESNWYQALRDSRFSADLDSKAIRLATGNNGNYYRGLTYNNSLSGYRKKGWMYDPKDKTFGIISDDDYNKKSEAERALYNPVRIAAGDLISDSSGIIYDTENPLSADDIKAGYNITGYKPDTKDTIDIQFPDSGGYNPLTSLRYMPALGAGIGAFTDLMGWTNKPDYSILNGINKAATTGNIPYEVSANPIGNYMAYNPLDRNYYANLLRALAGATRDRIANTSGGNRGVLMAGLLAADSNYLNGLGALARLAEEYNLGQREKVATFNRDTNKFNSELMLKAAMANLASRNSSRELALKGAMADAELRWKIDSQANTAKSANLTNLFNSLGNIGREEVMKSWINLNPYLMYAASTSGRGPAYTGASTSANGGYLTIKKGRKG